LSRRGPASLEQDRELIRQLKQRDGSAMLALYDRYGGLLYSVVYRAVRDQSTAEDLVQETLLRVWNRIQTFDGEKGSLSGWLVTIARNRAFDHLRSMRSGPQSFSDLDEAERLGLCPAHEPDGDRIAKQRAVAQALESLNDAQRDVIELTHFEGMTQTEIAHKLNKPLGTVKGLVRSALKVLRTAAGREGS
jgi:RNA polymerase sigma-70 factor (ECF subfamily)